MTTKLSLAILCITFLSVFRAKSQFSCGLDHNHTDSSLTQGENTRERLLRYYKSRKRESRRPQDNAYTIPVVVHVMHTGEPIGHAFNPTDAEINELIDGASQAFETTHPDVFSENDGGVDIGIKFVLAKRTKDCTPTNGINRLDLSQNAEYVQNGVDRTSSGGGLGDDSLKSISHWPTNEYLNIYLVKGFSTSIGGYANYPSPSAYPGYVRDGVVMKGTSLGTIVHEIGHWLNLRHTFDGSGESGTECPVNNNCETDGDRVCDTDPHIRRTGCNELVINPCTGLKYGNIVNNFMSYSCDKLFTQGQKERMIDALLALRPSLLKSKGAEPIGIESPGVYAISSDLDDNSCSGKFAEISVKDAANLGSNYSFDWYFNGVLSGVKSSAFSTRVYKEDTIKCVINTDYNCFSTDTILTNTMVFNNLRDEPTFDFRVDNTNPCIGDTVRISASNILNADPNYTIGWDSRATEIVDTFKNSTRFIADSVSHFIWIRFDPKNGCNDVSKGRSFVGKKPFIQSITIEDPNPEIKCEGSSHKFDIVEKSTQSRFILRWNINGEVKNEYPPFVSGSFSTIELKNDDIVTAEIESVEGCVWPKIVKSNEIKISAYPKLDYEIEDGKIIFTNLEESSFSLNQIIGNSTLIKTIEGNTFEPIDSGIYYASYYNGTCLQRSDNIEFPFLLTSLTNSNEQVNEVSISPNPSINYISINTKNEAKNDYAQISIHNLQGKEVSSRTILLNSKYEHNLSEGIYFLYVTIKGRSYMQKIIVND